MIIKIDSDIVKLEKVKYLAILLRRKDNVTKNTSSKWRHKIFSFSSPSLSKIRVALLVSGNSKKNLTIYSFNTAYL